MWETFKKDWKFYLIAAISAGTFITALIMMALIGFGIL